MLSTIFLHAGHLYATSIKLSDPSHFVAPLNFRFTPDGRYVLYNVGSELFSVPSTGGAPIRLAAIDVSVLGSYQLSTDGKYVVYSGTVNSGSRPPSIGLFSIPVDGSTPPVQLNLDVRFSGVDGFLVTPDGIRVIYVLDYEGLDQEDIYSVPITGPASASVKLSQRGTANRAVLQGISPDSSRVVYSLSNFFAATTQLYSVPATGPATARVLMSDHTSVSGISGLEFSPDGSRVFYFDNAEPHWAAIKNLYSVPLLGSPSTLVKLNGDLNTGDTVLNYAISADSSRAVYVLGERMTGGRELYSVPLSGPPGAGVRLTTNPPAGEIGKFTISPDSSRVIYSLSNQQSGFGELYSVPLAGPSANAALLYRTAVLAGKVSSFEVSRDSRRVVFLADQNTRNRPNFFSINATGPTGSAVRLNNDRTFGSESFGKSYYLTQDSRFVIYGSLSSSNQIALYRVPIQGPASSNQSVDSVPITQSTEFKVMPGDDRILYRLTTPDLTPPFTPLSELFVASIPAAPPPLGPTPQPSPSPSPEERPHRVYLPMLWR
jgi:dipeptidyl aminopeptidase/acylaminoacyl peptidase